MDNNKEQESDLIKTAPRLYFKTWVLDRTQMQVFDLKNTSAGLSHCEYCLLDILISSPNTILHRDDIRKNLGRASKPVKNNRTLNIKIARLRQKLGDNAQNAEIIKTVRNVGYLFCCPLTTDNQRKTL